MSIVVDSNCPEFGYELLSAVPYAYSLYLKGKLGGTVSAYDTGCLYYFSPSHTEVVKKRSWDNMNLLWKHKFPNIDIHKPEIDMRYFAAPPYKRVYAPQAIKFSKPTIVIFNRYNDEWGEPPINFLDLATLRKLFEMLSDIYQVVYINIKGHVKYYDGVEPKDLNEESVLKDFPSVLTINDLLDRYKGCSLNQVQMRLFAGCSRYISSNGGQLILSAYFGGEHVIFSRKCRELDPKVNSFYKWYHRLGDGVFQHVCNYQDLIDLVRVKWVENRPLINILIRTSRRKNYYRDCMESIYRQTYKNWNVITGIDNPLSLEYTQPHKSRDVLYDFGSMKVKSPPNNVEYGVKFIYNMYLNRLHDHVVDGYVMYLDDDDYLVGDHSLEKIAHSIKSEDDFVMWRVKFPNRLVPSNENFRKEPVMKDVSGIGFCFHIKNKVNWTPYKRGDYRVAKSLFRMILNKVFINEPLTGLQRTVEDGFGRRDDKKA